MPQIRFSNEYNSFEAAQKEAKAFIDGWGWAYQASASVRPIGKVEEKNIKWAVDFSRFDSAD